MRIGPSVAYRRGKKTNDACIFNPLLGCKGETVESSLFFKPVEFDGFKIRIIQMLPDSEKLNCVPVSEPISDQIIGTF